MLENRIIKMTPSQKIVIKKLLTGHFLRLVKRGSGSWYVLYDEKVNPISKVRAKTIDKLDRFLDPDQKLWKKDKNGDMTLNLNTVRQLHGKSTMKQLYKKRKDIESSGPIYKQRKANKKLNQKQVNEKISYLF